jgi:hypothetical protein
VSGGSVSPSAADFLRVRFERFREVVVEDTANVGVVYALFEREGTLPIKSTRAQIARNQPFQKQSSQQPRYSSSS